MEEQVKLAKYYIETKGKEKLWTRIILEFTPQQDQEAQTAVRCVNAETNKEVKITVPVSAVEAPNMALITQKLAEVGVVVADKGLKVYTVEAVK